MDTKEIGEAFETLNKDWDAFKAANDTRLKAIEASGGVAEVTEKLETIDKAIDAAVTANAAFAAEKKLLEDRLDEAEARMEQGPPQSKAERTAAEHKELFVDWVRHSADPGAAQALHSFEKKEVGTGTGAAGGFAVPEEISRQIHDQELLSSPVRQSVRVVTVGTSDYKELIDIHGETSGWVGETDSRTLTDTPTLRERVPTMGTLYAYPRTTEEALDDIFFNVQQWIVDSVSGAFVRAEGISALTGDGTNQLTGMLNTTPTVETDTASPVRSADAYEYIPLDTASPTSAIDPDALMDIVYRLRSHYRVNANWAMNSSVQGTIRKLKQNSEYIWTPGLTAGQQATLLGYPLVTWEDMDDADVTTNFVCAFGDFNRGYLLVDRVGLRMTIDNNITLPGYVKFYIRRREGGNVLDNNAIKWGRFDT